MLATVVREESAAKPFLLSIGDRADKLAEAYENRQIDTQVALSEERKVSSRIHRRQRRTTTARCR
jgi:type I restriction enzyme R subunit